MGSSIAPAKVRAVSWDGLEKVELFTEAVKQQLAALKVQRRVTVGPKVPLPEATLDRVIMCIWCVCYCGMPWRAACRLADLPFGTVYSCCARWGRLGLWKVVLLDLLRRWRVACGDNPAPSVVLVDSRSCRSAPTCGQRGIDGGKKVKGVKINLVVDKPGFPLAVSIAKANVQDTTSRTQRPGHNVQDTTSRTQRPGHARHCPGPARGRGRRLPRQGPGRSLISGRQAPGDWSEPGHRGRDQSRSGQGNLHPDGAALGG